MGVAGGFSQLSITGRGHTGLLHRVLCSASFNALSVFVVTPNPRRKCDCRFVVKTYEVQGLILGTHAFVQLVVLQDFEA